MIIFEISTIFSYGFANPACELPNSYKISDHDYNELNALTHEK